VAELLRRERAPHPLPRTTIEAFESQAAGMMPGWMAHDFRLMLRALHRFCLIPGKDSRATFEALIGHPLRSYPAFAEEAAASW
jgi:hypothetical protein